MSNVGRMRLGSKLSEQYYRIDLCEVGDLVGHHFSKVMLREECAHVLKCVCVGD